MTPNRRMHLTGYQINLGLYSLSGCLTKRPDTVGQPPGTEIGVSNMPSLQAKKLRKLPQEKVLLEL